MRLPRFSLLQFLLAAALCCLVIGLVTSAWRAVTHAHVSHLEFSPSGKYLAAKYSSGGVRVWNLTGSRPQLAAQFSGGRFLDYDYGPLQFLDDSTIVEVHNRSSLAGFETVVRIMDLRSGTVSESAVIPLLAYVPSFAAGGNRVATPNWNAGTVEIYRLPSGNLERSVKLGGNPWFVSLSPDGKTLAATDEGGGIHIIDVATGTILRTVTGSTAATSLDIGGERLATAAWSGNPPALTVELIDLQGNGTPQKLSTGVGTPMWVALTADGSKLAVSGYDAFEYHDLKTGKRLTRIVIPGGDLDGDFGFFPSFPLFSAHNMALSPDGKSLASFRQGQVTLRDLPSGRIRHRISGGWRSLQIAIFTLGFAGWAAAWGIVSRRERLRRPPAPRSLHASRDVAAGRPMQPVPNMKWQLVSVLVWIAIVVVALALLTGQTGANLLQVAATTLVGLVSIVAAVIALAIGYAWLVRLVMGPHFLSLQRLRQLTSDQGRLYRGGSRDPHGKLSLAFFGESTFEADRDRHVDEVLRGAAKLFGQPVEFDRETMIACVDRQCDLDAFIMRHCPIAAVVPNVWTARLALVCEETAHRAVSDPANSFRGALALLLTIQHKRGLPPAWTGTLFTQQIAPTNHHDAAIRAAVRRLGVRLARDADWDPVVVFQRNANQRAELWLACDQQGAWHQVQAEIDVLTTLGAMLLGDSAPPERREKVVAWLRGLRPSDDAVASLERVLGKPLHDLLTEWRTWLAQQGGLPYDPLPLDRFRSIATLHLPILQNRALSSDVRCRAVRQLGGSGYVAASGILIDLLADPDWNLRLEVIEALESLSGDLFGDDPAAWLAWYRRLPEETRSFAAGPPIEATILDDAAPAAEGSPGPIPAAAQRQLPVPVGLKLCWGLMVLGGLAALAIPITMMFLIGPLLFPTVYFGLFVGVLAVARGAGRDTQGLKNVATLQGICIIACDPINLLLGAMEHNLLSRPRVQEFLLDANGGRL